MNEAYGSDWRVFLVGYGALWVLLSAMVDAGAPAEFAAALALSIAGGATVIYLPAVLDNMKLITKGGGTDGSTQQ
jgi:hypothetical protein